MYCASMRQKQEKEEKKEKSSFESSKGFYYCPTPLVAQLTLVQASASLMIEMAYRHSVRYVYNCYCMLDVSKTRDRMRKSDRDKE